MGWFFTPPPFFHFSFLYWKLNPCPIPFQITVISEEKKKQMLVTLRKIFLGCMYWQLALYFQWKSAIKPHIKTVDTFQCGLMCLYRLYHNSYEIKKILLWVSKQIRFFFNHLILFMYFYLFSLFLKDGILGFWWAVSPGKCRCYFCYIISPCALLSVSLSNLCMFFVFNCSGFFYLFTFFIHFHLLMLYILIMITFW